MSRKYLADAGWRSAPSPHPPFPRLFPGPALSPETWISILQRVRCGSTNPAGPRRNGLRCKGDNQRRLPRGGCSQELKPKKWTEGRESCPYRRPDLCQDLWERISWGRGYGAGQPASSRHGKRCMEQAAGEERYGCHPRGSAGPACKSLPQSGPCLCLDYLLWEAGTGTEWENMLCGPLALVVFLE